MHGTNMKTAVKFDYFRRCVQGTSQEEGRNGNRKQIGFTLSVIGCDCAEGIMVEELLICVLHCL